MQWASWWWPRVEGGREEGKEEEGKEEKGLRRASCVINGGRRWACEETDLLLLASSLSLSLVV